MVITELVFYLLFFYILYINIFTAEHYSKANFMRFRLFGFSLKTNVILFVPVSINVAVWHTGSFAHSTTTMIREIKVFDEPLLSSFAVNLHFYRLFLLFPLFATLKKNKGLVMIQLIKQ